MPTQTLGPWVLKIKFKTMDTGKFLFGYLA